MKTNYDPFSPENLAQIRAKQQNRPTPQSQAEANENDGQKPPERKGKPPKKRSIDFLQLDIALLRKLGEVNAPCNVWLMVSALSEAWFATGVCNRHLNPFPLSIVDAQRWGLDRRRKHEALKFLARACLIEVDRSAPKNPSVTLCWKTERQAKASV